MVIGQEMTSLFVENHKMKMWAKETNCVIHYLHYLEASSSNPESGNYSKCFWDEKRKKKDLHKLSWLLTSLRAATLLLTLQLLRRSPLWPWPADVSKMLTDLFCSVFSISDFSTALVFMKGRRSIRSIKIVLSNLLCNFVSVFESLLRNRKFCSVLCRLCLDWVEDWY